MSRISTGSTEFVYEDQATSRTYTFAIDYQITKGEPMVRYTRNGDGYPGSPDECELLAFRCLWIEELVEITWRRRLAEWGLKKLGLKPAGPLVDTRGYRPDDADARSIGQWFSERVAGDYTLTEEIEEDCFADADGWHEWARDAAAETVFERMRERGLA